MKNNILLSSLLIVLLLSSTVVMVLPSADAVKSQGTAISKFGKDTKRIVCGDKLCSEVEKEKEQEKKSRGDASQQSRFSMGGVVQQGVPIFRNESDLSHELQSIPTINPDDYPKIQRTLSDLSKHTAFTDGVSYIIGGFNHPLTEQSTELLAVMKNKHDDCYKLITYEEPPSLQTYGAHHLDLVSCTDSTVFRVNTVNTEPTRSARDTNPFSFIRDPKIDSKINLYYNNISTNKLVKVSTSGVTLFEIPMWNMFGSSKSFDLDSNDNLYVPGPNHSVLIYDTNGNHINTWSNIPYNNDPTHEIQPYTISTFSSYTGSASLVDSHWNTYINHFQGYKDQINIENNSGCNSSDKIRSVTSFDPQGLTDGRAGASGANDQYGSGIVLDIPIVSTRGFYSLDSSSQTGAQLRTGHTNTEYNASNNLFELNPCFVVILVHGYNNSFENSKGKYYDFYDRLVYQQTPGLADNVILYTWDSDTSTGNGKIRYDAAEKIARANGAALATFIKDYKTQHPHTQIFIFAHSMGAELTHSAMSYLDANYATDIKIDQIDFIGASTDANQLDTNHFGYAYMHRLHGPLINHVNSNDDALGTAKSIGAVNNPLGMEGFGSSCRNILTYSGIFGVAVDNNDNIYAVDPSIGKIYKLDLSGKLLATYNQFYDDVTKTITHFDTCNLQLGKLIYFSDQFFLGNDVSSNRIYFEHSPKNPTINGEAMHNILSLVTNPSGESVSYNLSATDQKTKLDPVTSVPLSCSPTSPVLVKLDETKIVHCVGKDEHENQILVDFLVSGVPPYKTLDKNIAERTVSNDSASQSSASQNSVKVANKPVPSAVTTDVSVYASKDSFINSNSQHANNGGHLELFVNPSNRILVGFNGQDIANALQGKQIVSASLSLSNYPQYSLGTSGKNIAIHKLLSTWTEGNGKVVDMSNYGSPVRGTGSGVTWNCHADTDISDSVDNCKRVWSPSEAGGKFATTPTDVVLVTNDHLGGSGIGNVLFDVTADVKNFVNGTSTNAELTWLIKLNDESQNGMIKFISREGANICTDTNGVPHPETCTPKLIVTTNP